MAFLEFWTEHHKKQNKTKVISLNNRRTRDTSCPSTALHVSRLRRYTGPELESRGTPDVPYDRYDSLRTPTVKGVDVLLPSGPRIKYPSVSPKSLSHHISDLARGTHVLSEG